MKITVALSIHNRSELFRRALPSYLVQTMPPEDWEIILVDDMSSEDLREVCEPLSERINITHIYMDHTRHPIFKEMNPNWDGSHSNWYHTPAISLNIAMARARGDVVCLCHPEIIHAPTNFERAWEILGIRKERQFVFGRTYLGTQATNRAMENLPATLPWDRFVEKIELHKIPHFRSNEQYWYTSFLPREACEVVGGVDFEYLRGVAGEDDDFRERVKRAGYAPVTWDNITGLHQDHMHETEHHHRRDTPEWEAGLIVNRRTFFGRRDRNKFPVRANVGYDWTGSECVVGSFRRGA